MTSTGEISSLEPADAAVGLGAQRDRLPTGTTTDVGRTHLPVSSTPSGGVHELHHE